MKAFLLTAITAACVFFSAKAQVYVKNILKKGESLSLPSYYLFPSFKDAVVSLDAGRLESKMNYNLLICEMQFIDNEGDTLNIAHPANVGLITFDSSSFIYKDEVYYEIFAKIDSIAIAVVRKASFEPLTIGAFGTASHSGAGIANYTSLMSSSGDRRLTVNEDINITRETINYLLLPNGEKLKANKSNFLKLFSIKKLEIEKYFKENKVNFNNESDLKKLAMFL